MNLNVSSGKYRAAAAVAGWLIVSVERSAEARMAPAPEPTPEGPAPALLGGNRAPPAPPIRPQPAPPMPAEVAAEVELDEPTRKKKQAAQAVESPAAAPTHAGGENEEEPFDPGLRQNVFGRPVSPQWDAEKIINTDRPDFTDVLPTVGKGVWQTESGLSFRSRRGEDGEYAFHRWSAPETLLRLGLTKRLELRVRWDSYWFTDRQGTAATPGASYGSDLLLGFKWQAVPQTGWVPGHTFLGTLIYHAGTGRGPAQTAIQPGLNWCYGWQINKWLVFRGSTGFEVTVREPQAIASGETGPTYDPPTRQTFVELHQSTVTYIQVFKHLGMYYEWFAFWYYGQEKGMQHNGGVGAYIYITPNVQIDARFGGSLAGWPKENFYGVGVSFRGRYDKKKGSRSIMK